MVLVPRCVFREVSLVVRLIIWRNRQATPRWRLVDRETKAETEAEIEREREQCRGSTCASAP